MTTNRKTRRRGAGWTCLVLALAAMALPRTAAGQAVDESRKWPGRYPWTEADANFMVGMISHHAQAIQMADLTPTRTETRAIRVLSARVINAQQDEIVLMQQWLADRGQPVPEAKPTPMKMKMGGVEHEMMMPGMLTDEQMQALEQARGVEYDRLFLTYMIQHHEGALTMVAELNGSHGAGQDDIIFRMASDIYADQSTEIERMQQMLSTLPPR